MSDLANRIADMLDATEKPKSFLLVQAIQAICQLDQMLTNDEGSLLCELVSSVCRGSVSPITLASVMHRRPHPEQLSAILRRLP